MLRKHLNNGLDVCIQESSFSKMFALQCWIHVGSIHETTGEEGMSHCLEHMLFKGTRKFAVGELSRRVEFLGGEMNAYTSFDHTVFYLTLPSMHAAEAVEILAEAIFHSTFDAEELAREKEVILEEMKRSDDSPSHALGRKIFETIYAGTPAAQPIIGFEANIEAFTREDVQRFHQKWYQPTNMKLIGVGNVKAASLIQHVETHFGSAVSSNNFVEAELKVNFPKELTVHVVEGDYEQARIEISFPAPSLMDEDMLAIDMAAFALGSGESARLNRKIRDEKQLTSVVGCSMFAPKFGGVIELSAMPRDESYLECIKALGEELARLKYHEGVNQEELDRARANAKADRIYSEETVSGQARSIGNALQTPHGLLFDYVMEAKMNRLTPYDVNASLSRWLISERAVIACVLPKTVSVTADQVKKAFLDGFVEPKHTITQRARKPDPEGIYHEQLTPQITVIYRQQDRSDLLNLMAVASGGLRIEKENETGLFHMIADLLGTATEELDYDEMLNAVEGRGAVLAGFSGRDSCGLKLQCLTEQTDALLPVFADCLMKPVFYNDQLESTKLEIFDDIHMEQDSPSSLAMRRFQQAMYEDHPYQYPVWGKEEIVRAWTPESLLESFKTWRDGSHWIISGVGRIPFEDLMKKLEVLFKDLKRPVPKAKGLVVAMPQKLASGTFQIEKDREQVHLVMGTLGLNWHDSDRYALDLLSNVLGGSGGQMFLKLRDEQSLAYTVAPMQSAGCHRGIFGAYMACSPHKLEEAEEGILKLWDDLCKKGVTQDELDRARNYLVGSHEGDMQRADSQAMTMGLMELYGLGYNDFSLYTARLNKIEIADLQRVAKRLLEGQNRVTVKVGPFAGKQ
ncbi:MAG: insulinase family protein [Chitinophagaceae bacterium]|nr:insulinase family protein [Oligoflexus sp.]